jgi:hypothetical protein
MNRRKLMASAMQAVAAALFPMPAPAQASGLQTEGKPAQRPAMTQPDALVPPSLMGQEAEAAYFGERELETALGTKDLQKPQIEVVAFNFPSWHPSPFMEQHFGQGWSEFDTLRNARALFPGHTMPHFPLWGYYDESDPVWAAREVELASSFGVDAWMIDWYWHEGTQFYHEQLEQGLLRAENRASLKFAIMWANHDWKNVYPARSPDEAAILLPQIHTLSDFEKVANYCAEHYFSQPNYLTIDGAHVFALFDAGKVVEQLGEDGLRRSLDLVRERAHRLGFPRLHLQVCNGFQRYERRLRSLGFDSAAAYGTIAWTYGDRHGVRLPYGLAAREAVTSWQQRRENLDVPYYPTVSVGWDDSPRFGEYAGVAINRSPDQFERLMRAARHFTASSQGSRLVYIGAWNEWTEDGVLLPDTIWGYSYLEALRRAVRS